MQSRRPTSGFSLLELMIVIAIVGVLAAIAIPSFNDLIKNNRRTVVVNELMGNFMLARAEAAKQGRPVVVCGNTSGDLLNCAGVNNWNHGWIAAVWVDADSDDSVDSGELQAPMRQYVNDYPDIKITAGGTGPFKVKPFTQSSTNATITVCDKRGPSKARALIMSGNGRARVSETTSTGSVLTCPS